MPPGDPQQAVHEPRRRARQRRRDEGFGEDEGRLEPPTDEQKQESNYAQPTGLVNLPGVDAGDADEEKEAHARLEGCDDGPRAGVDRRDDIWRMDRLDEGENDPRHQSSQAAPTD